MDNSHQRRNGRPKNDWYSSMPSSYTSAVIQPDPLYAAECLAKEKFLVIMKLKVKGKAIMVKLLGPIKANHEYRRWNNHELYARVQKITVYFFF